MYIAPYLLNVKIKNNSNEIIRGLELTYLNDVGRKARVSKVKTGESIDVIIVTKNISEDNKFILKLKSGKAFEINKDIIENPIDSVLEININKFEKENIDFNAEYVKLA